MTLRALGVVLAGFALTLAALMFGTVPLLVPGVAFVMLGVGAPAWVSITARGASVQRHLELRRVLEGDPLQARIEVKAPRLTVSEVIEPLATDAIPLPSGASAGSRLITVRFQRRGRHLIERPSLVIRDPLELARHVLLGSGPASELLVLPRTEPVRTLRKSGRDRGSEASGPWSEALAAVDLDGLRSYRPGTSAARIHWPALARGAGLLERRLCAENDELALIVLDACGAAGAEHLDAAVRAAGSLALDLARRGGCGLLLPGERHATSIWPELGAWRAAHARLAVVRGGEGVPAPALGIHARRGPLFYVAARTLEGLPAPGRRVARGGTVLVLPATLVGPIGPTGRSLPASFEVAGCLGYAIRGHVRELPRTPLASAAPGPESQ